MWMSPWQRRQAILYGDVVIFDPTYNANDQRMPHSHFTIVDNMMKSQEVAQALHLNEQTATFEWMFRCYLEAAPRMKTMFTDQDDAIAAAILLTNICDKHRLCLWHILMNMTKHLGKVLGTDFDGLRNAIIALASNEYGNSTTAWELEWTAVLDKYENISGEYKQIKYLHSLYKHKEQWARAFQYGVIDLNIRTTQRGESINAHSKHFIGRQTTMYQVRGLAYLEFEVNRKVMHDTRAAYEMYCTVRTAHHQAWYIAIAGVVTSAVLKLLDKQMELASNTISVYKSTYAICKVSSWSSTHRSREPPHGLYKADQEGRGREMLAAAYKHLAKHRLIRIGLQAAYWLCYYLAAGFHFADATKNTVRSVSRRINRNKYVK